MKTSTLLLVGVGCMVCCCSVLAAAVAFVYLSDPFRGLPTTPPAIPSNLTIEVHASVVFMLKWLFRAKSSCWHANKWLRVTVPKMIIEAAKEMNGVRTGSDEERRIGTKWINLLVKSTSELEKCSRTAKIVHEPSKFSRGVREIAGMLIAARLFALSAASDYYAR